MRPKRKGSKGPTREEVERLSPAPTPQQQLMDARARLAWLKGEEKPRDVLARYEREVQRLEVWIAQGAPKVDEMAQAVLTYFLAHPKRGQSLPWPLPDLGTGDVQVIEWPNEQLVHACRALVNRWKRRLIPRVGEPRRKVKLALHALAKRPPGPVENAQTWHIKPGGKGYERARALAVQRGIFEAMELANALQPIRIGEGKRSAWVEAVPALSGLPGAVKWLDQVVPKFAAEWLLALIREDVQPNADQVEWQADALDHNSTDSPDAPEDYLGRMMELLQLAEVWPQFSPTTDNGRRVRLVAIAKLPRVVEHAVASGAITVTPEEEEALQRVLATPYTRQRATGDRSANEIEELTDGVVPRDQVPVYWARFRAKAETSS